MSEAVGKEETIHSWAYQDALEAALPQSKQRHLEKVYKALEHTSAKWMIRNTDTAKPIRNSDLPYTAVGIGNNEQQPHNQVVQADGTFNQGGYVQPRQLPQLNQNSVYAPKNVHPIVNEH